MDLASRLSNFCYVFFSSYILAYFSITREILERKNKEVREGKQQERVKKKEKGEGEKYSGVLFAVLFSTLKFPMSFNNHFDYFFPLW